jgi:hypothetical protein
VVVATYVIQHPAIGVPDEIIAPNKEKSRKDGNDPNGKVPFRVCFMRLVRVISFWSPFPGSFPSGHHFRCTTDRHDAFAAVWGISSRCAICAKTEHAIDVVGIAGSEELLDGGYVVSRVPFHLYAPLGSLLSGILSPSIQTTG